MSPMLFLIYTYIYMRWWWIELNVKKVKMRNRECDEGERIDITQ